MDSPALDKNEIPYASDPEVKIARESYLNRYTGHKTEGVIVVLHGIQSHRGWYVRSCVSLAQHGFCVYAPDRLGSGTHAVNRGDVDNFEDFIEDIDSLVKRSQEEHPNQPLYLLGISWGGKLALLYELLKPGVFKGLILCTPGLCPKIDLSLRIKIKISRALLSKSGQKRVFPIPIDNVRWFTDSLFWQEWIKQDPLSLHAATASFFYEDRKMDQYIKKNTQFSLTPIFIQLAGRDDLIHNEKTLRLLKDHSINFQNLVTVKTYPFAKHTLDFEDNWREVNLDRSDVLHRWAKFK